jgi:hypothetical protein
MTPRLHCPIALLVAAYALSSLPTPARAAGQYPEIVRLSYIEGDVRVNEGKAGKVDLDAPWGHATAGMPIEEGFTVSTGTGRAEIEFENGWTAYVADNSTVEFNFARTQANVPRSILMILNGTLSVDFRPGKSETLLVETPSGQAARFTTAKSVRLESFLDALAVTMEDEAGDDVELPGKEGVHIDRGRSVVYGLGGAIPGSWAHSKTRADGKFFDCAPYGRCWAPNPGEGEGAIENSSTREAVGPTADTSTKPVLGTSFDGQSSSANAAGNNSGRRSRSRYQVYVRRYPGPHCSMMTDTVVQNLDTGEERVVSSVGDQRPWNQPLCHAGSFIYSRDAGYTWVVGKKHHRPPYHWVKYHGGNGVVPWHPRDVPGKRPINMMNGVISVSAKNAAEHELLQTSQLKKVELLSSTPKEFQRNARPQLAEAARPQIRARFAFGEVEHTSPFTFKEISAPITYEYGRHSFVREPPTSPGGHPSKPVVVARVNSESGVKRISLASAAFARVGSDHASDSGSGRSSGPGTGASGSGSTRGGDSGHTSGGGSSGRGHSGTGGVSSGGGGGSGHSGGGSSVGSGRPSTSGGEVSHGGGFSGGGGSHEAGGGGGGGGVRPR